MSERFKDVQIYLGGWEAYISELEDRLESAERQLDTARGVIEGISRLLSPVAARRGVT